MTYRDSQTGCKHGGSTIQEQQHTPKHTRLLAAALIMTNPDEEQEKLKKVTESVL